MAEVSLRLFRGRTWQRCIEDGVPGRSKQGAMLTPSCVVSRTPCREKSAYASETSHKLLLKTVWPSRALKGKSLWESGDGVVTARHGVLFTSQWANSRAFSGQNGGHRSSAPSWGPPLYKSPTAYYDILEVSGKATQAQIKTAYYKQSFRFHPDRNSGDEASARQFGLVTEAYHILGSTSLRKKYDRGTLSLNDVQTAKKPNGKSSSSTFKEASGQKGASSNQTSKTPTKPMFDFDAFYQAHYGEQLAREQFWKARREHIEKKKEEKNLSKRLNRMNEFSALLLFLSAMVMLVSYRG
ncbi:dnaJ homolog subfamily C member 30, mitochondrial [Mixophyes fleayi]|uniref:dnaJ homolog subfamily C member 30, mitochondrial n=1 Tax=Mixophyes fleayi TaxID=3061075 RepID=UPI003F4DF990